MAVDCGDFILPLKCFECSYSTKLPDENLRSGGCLVSLKEHCPRTADGLKFHVRLIRQGKRAKDCMVQPYVRREVMTPRLKSTLDVLNNLKQDKGAL